MEYSVLAYYIFAPIDDPQKEVTLHKKFCSERDIKGRLYISEQGINGQMSAAPEAAKEYMTWMSEKDPFTSMPFKLHHWHCHTFDKLTIKYREKLVGYDVDVDTANQGEHVSPKKWKELLESEEEKVLIDVRNDYEWEVGRFENAETPQCRTFRDFEKYAKELKDRIDPKNTPVMMYCTGGIRCELYSAHLKEKGFEKVYQLQGGVIDYGLKEGSAHWLGKLFVFDDRMVTPISNEVTPIISSCHTCGKESDHYYNCANMDCNKLFLSCDECLEKLMGCCKSTCSDAPRRRPLEEQNPNKPFRKWYKYFESKPGLCGK